MSDQAIGGPFTARRMMEMYETGTICADSLTAVAGDSSWQPFRHLLAVVRYDVAHPVPLPPVEDFEAQIQAAKRSGPPTPPVLAQLLEEEHQFPRPRPVVRKRTSPPSPILLNPRLRKAV